MGNPTALITGASSGIGWELAKVFAKNNYNLVLTARREENLKKLQSELQTDHNSIEYIVCDLSEHKAPSDLYTEIKNKNISVNTLVNNAGFGASGSFSRLELKNQKNLLQVNINSLTELTHLFLNDMLQTDTGEILNVSSTAAFQSGPNMAVYYASKAYVLSFTEALAEELLNTKIKVCCLCPGATESEFQKAAGMVRTPLFERIMMSAADVAEAGYKSLKKENIICLPGALNKITPIFAKLLPRSWIRKKVKKFNTLRLPQELPDKN